MGWLEDLLGVKRKRSKIDINDKDEGIDTDKHEDVNDDAEESEGEEE